MFAGDLLPFDFGASRTELRNDSSPRRKSDFRDNEDKSFSHALKAEEHRAPDRSESKRSHPIKNENSETKPSGSSSSKLDNSEPLFANGNSGQQAILLRASHGIETAPAGLSASQGSSTLAGHAATGNLALQNADLNSALLSIQSAASQQLQNGLHPNSIGLAQQNLSSQQLDLSDSLEQHRYSELVHQSQTGRGVDDARLANDPNPLIAGSKTSMSGSELPIYLNDDFSSLAKPDNSTDLNLVNREPSHSNVLAGKHSIQSDTSSSTDHNLVDLESTNGLGLKGSSNSRPLTQLSNKINGQISLAVKAHITRLPAGHSTLTVRLDPPHLGKVIIDFDNRGDSFKISIHSDNHLVRQVLESDLKTLVENLNQSGVSIDDVDVSEHRNHDLEDSHETSQKTNPNSDDCGDCTIELHVTSSDPNSIDIRA